MKKLLLAATLAALGLNALAGLTIPVQTPIKIAGPTNANGTYSSSYVGTFKGDGSGLTNITVTNLPSALITNGATGVTLTGTFKGNGAGLTNLSLTNLPAAVLTNSSSGVTLSGTFNGNSAASLTNILGSQNFLTLGALGASNNDTAAFQLAAASGRTIYFPRASGPYLLCTNLVLTNNTKFLSDGASIYCLQGSNAVGGGSPTNYALSTGYLIAGPAYNHNVNCSIVGLTLIGFGNGSPATEQDYNGILFNVCGGPASVLDQVKVYGFTGAGIRLQSTYGQGLIYTNRSHLKGGEIQSCYYGLDVDAFFGSMDAEYVELLDFNCVSNTYGIRAQAGNHRVTGCNFLASTKWNCWIVGDYNSGHGGFVNCSFNHYGVAGAGNLLCDTVKLGELFTGCHFAAAGQIYIKGSVGVQIQNCSIGLGNGASPTPITFNRGTLPGANYFSGNTYWGTNWAGYSTVLTNDGSGIISGNIAATNYNAYGFPDNDGSFPYQTIVTNIVLAFPATLPGNTTNLLVMSGVNSNALVTVSAPQAATPINGIYTGWVSNTTVWVRFTNPQSSGNLTPASGTFKVKIEQWP